MSGFSAVDLAIALTPAHQKPLLPTDEQIAVIEAPPGESAIVLAGAGSGKTTTMASRVVWLVANGHVTVPEVLGLTFTRKAAASLAQRVRTALDDLVRADLLRDGTPGELDLPSVATYNSFANSVFHENALLIGREPDSAVLSEASAWQLARHVVVTSSDSRLVDLDRGVDGLTAAVLSLSRELADNDVDRGALAGFAADFAALEELPYGARRRMPSKEVVRAAAVVGEIPVLLDLVARYEAEKRRRGFIEFGDQVALALQVVEASAKVRDFYRARYKVVLLDEYQDTSVSQTRLLSSLFHGHPVMAVGDPNQSIYGWRGASAANIENFGVDFTGAAGGATEYPLMTSWRNPVKVLDIANALVSPLVGRDSPRLSPAPSAENGDLDLVFTETIDDEAGAVAEWFKAQLAVPGKDGAPRSAALLCASLKRISPFLGAFRDADVPYHVLGIGGLLDQPVIADLVSALRVIHDPLAGSELIRLLAGPRWRVGPRDIQSLRHLAERITDYDGRFEKLDAQVKQRLRQSVARDEGASIVDAVDVFAEADLGRPLFADFSPPARERIADLARVLRRLRSRAGLDLPDFVALVIQTLGLDIEARANESAPLAEAALTSFRELVGDFLLVDERTSLGAFLGWLAEVERHEDRDLPQQPPEPGTVQVITIHAAKGLEWDVVAVPRQVAADVPGKPHRSDGYGWLQPGRLPYPFRLDSAALPVLDWRGVTTQAEFEQAVDEFKAGVLAHHERERRRVAYVAVTRPRDALLISGSYWDHRATATELSPLYAELVEERLLDASGTAERREAARPEIASQAGEITWPLHPLGARETRVKEAAAAVRAAAGRPIRDSELQILLDVLLSEHRAGDSVRALPQRVSASKFKDYATKTAETLDELWRPMPERPYRQTRLGTRFHSWVEQRAQLAGSVDEIDDALAGDTDLDVDASEAVRFEALTANFEGSRWAGRQPAFVEIELQYPLAGQVFVCKLDAVYALDDGSWQIVDWKTGTLPKRAADGSFDPDDMTRWQFQLALYRAAFASWRGLAPESVSALFYFVADDVVVEPQVIYGPDQLAEVWSSVEASVSSSPDSGSGSIG